MVGKGGRVPVDALAGYVRRDGVPAVDGLAQDVEHPAKGRLPHRDLDGLAGGGDLHAPGQALAARQHDAADRIAAHMLGNLHDPALAVQLHSQGLLDPGQVSGFKRHIHHRAGYLRDRSDFHTVIPRFQRFPAVPPRLRKFL